MLPGKGEEPMLFRNMKTFLDYTILAQGDEIGKVDDFFFDDTTWTIRYLVVNTGNWLTGRKVLLSPTMVTRSYWETQLFEVNLTRQQVKDSPGIKTDQPVSLQHQIAQVYWTAQHYMPMSILPILAPARSKEDLEGQEEKNDRHLRSACEVMGYHVQATDDDIGHVDDFLVEDESWAIHYMVVDTRNWLPGKRVLVSPRWIRWVGWDERRVAVNITQNAVKDSPEYVPTKPLSRVYEEQLHEHYELPKH